MGIFPRIWKKNKNLFFFGDRELSLLRPAPLSWHNLERSSCQVPETVYILRKWIHYRASLRGRTPDLGAELDNETSGVLRHQLGHRYPNSGIVWS